VITIIEKNEILVLHKQSKSIREIVKITGRSRNTVRYYIREFEQLNNQLKNAKDKSQIELIQAQICRKPEKKKVTYKKRAFTLKSR
jgi:transposase